jgi:hypothetical protein
VGHGVAVAWQELALVERLDPNIVAKTPGDNDDEYDATFTTPPAVIVGACAKTAVSHIAAASIASTILDGFNILGPPGENSP